MDIINIQKDYSWVLKVLESCLNVEQVKVTERAFENFLKKWSSEISEVRSITFSSNFQKLKSKKLIDIR